MAQPLILEEMKLIADARTKGEWRHDWGNHDIEIPYPNRSESLLERGADANYNANLEFAAMAANNWDKLVAVVETANSLHKRLIEAEPIAIIIYNMPEITTETKSLQQKLEQALKAFYI